jgi:hypothetical protein
MALFAWGGALLSAAIAMGWNPARALNLSGILARWNGSSWGPAWWSSAPWAVTNWNMAPWNPAPWSPVWIAAVLFALPASALLLLAFRPAIEIHDAFLKIGRREIPWSHIRRVDQTGWNVPLAVNLTLKDGSRALLIYAGDLDSSAGLLRHLRRWAREALLDGVPYRQFWGEPASKRTQLAPPRYRLLRPEDEEEVERMFRRLKTVGHLDQRSSDES